MDEDQELPSLEHLLPTVHVDPSVLRHVRTLFYSSTKNHQHLANLSATQAQNPCTLTITAMLPTTSVPATAHALFSPSFRPNTALTLPLVSNLTGTPPPLRRPTHNLHSLIALFPPCATCQSSPLLRLHLTLPSVRIRLTAASPISSSPVTLSQNSLTILLTTGQSSEVAGLLLTNRRDTMRSAGREVLQPAPFSASGDVAGVWVRGNDKVTTTLALHALAAAWWTRRNRRLPQYPSSPQMPSGDWYERRVRCLQFPTSGGDPTIQTGVIAVRDDVGVRYIADIVDGGSAVAFIATSSLRRVPPGSPTSVGKPNREEVLGDDWRGGWVPSPTERELRDARNSRVLPHREDRKDENMTGPDLARVSSSRRRSQTKRQSTGLGRSRWGSSSPVRRHPSIVDNSGSISVDKLEVDKHQIRREQIGDPPWLTERMRPLCFTRRDDIAITGAEICREIQSNQEHGAEEKCGSTNGNDISKHPLLRIAYRNMELFSDSDGELGSEDTEVDMEQLCRKYLNNGYLHEVRRHKVGFLANDSRRFSREN